MDSCCFIELACHVIGKSETGRDNDIWFLKQLLNAALDGETEILTSTLSIAECQHAKSDISDDVKSLFKRFLTSGQYVLLVQDSVLVAEKARNLRWVHGLSFSGADPIHLASAMELKCEEFLTFDNQLHARATELNDLALPIRFPHVTKCLPGEYRQTSLIAAGQPQATPSTEEPTHADKQTEKAERRPTEPAPAELRSSLDSPGEDEAGTEAHKAKEPQEGS